MIERSRANIKLAEAYQAEVLEGNAESIPLRDASVDVVTSNGVLNLVPKKEQQELLEIVGGTKKDIVLSSKVLK